jgi:hypothetical protein
VPPGVFASSLRLDSGVGAVGVARSRLASTTVAGSLRGAMDELLFCAWIVERPESEAINHVVNFINF